MTWVWDQSKSRKTQRLVLLAIADCASDDGANAYPSMAELIRKTGFSERAVQSAIGELIAMGELRVERNGGPKGCNRYAVIMTPAGDAPPQEMRGARRAGGRKDEGPQVKTQHPAGDAPPAAPAPPQELRQTPAAPAPGTVLEPSLKNSSSKSSPKGVRGTRIPKDFGLTAEMIAWGRARVPRVNGKLETEKFINYWTAKSGRDAAKVDWDATWRNWMLEAARRQGDAPSTLRHVDDLTPDERAARNPFRDAIRASDVVRNQRDDH